MRIHMTFLLICFGVAVVGLHGRIDTPPQRAQQCTEIQLRWLHNNIDPRWPRKTPGFKRSKVQAPPHSIPVLPTEADAVTVEDTEDIEALRNMETLLGPSPS